MVEAKDAITLIVNEYVSYFREEFDLFKKSVAIKKDQQRTDFGETKMDFVERILFEIPETLHTSLQLRLTEPQKEWFHSKEGSQWFAKTFKQFQVTQRV